MSDTPKDPTLTLNSPTQQTTSPERGDAKSCAAGHLSKDVDRLLLLVNEAASKNDYDFVALVTANGSGADFVCSYDPHRWRKLKHLLRDGSAIGFVGVRWHKRTEAGNVDVTVRAWVLPDPDPTDEWRLYAAVPRVLEGALQ